ncbi:MAG: acyl carrier protein [Gammaproteobacteria bacterium]|nr:acyl carrier protein [Gammaproteobacteria bacterium]
MTVKYDEILDRLGLHLQQVAGTKLEFDEDTNLIEGLGLNSYKVLDLMLEVEDEFDISVPMNLLTDVHTVRDLAQLIEQLKPAQ